MMVTESEMYRYMLEVAKAAGFRSITEAITTARLSRADAERYRWLREQHWRESNMAVVCDPKNSVKLGFDCPSGQRLDAAIDEAIAASTAL